MINWRLPTLTALVLLAACSDSGSSGGGGGASSSAFTGIVTSDDGITSGSLTFTVATTSLVRTAPTGPSLMGSATASGSLKYGGSTTAVTGTYNDATNALSLSGGGYTLDGVFDGVDRLEGTMGGTASGTFVTTKSKTATAYCGTFTVTSGSGDTGTFSFVIAGATVRGNAVSSTDGSVIALDGTFAGGTINIYFPGSTSTPYLATGTKTGTTVSGTFDTGSDSGTWAGGTCQ